MRRAWMALLVGLIMVAGCGASVDKRGFLSTLINLCAQVNERVEGIAATDNPELYARQLGGLAEEIRSRSREAPQEGVEHLERFVTSLEDSADRLQMAAELEGEGRTATVEAGLERLATADQAAQAYGMPPLDTCDEQVAGEVASEVPPSPSPAEYASPAPSASSSAGLPSLPTEETPGAGAGLTATQWRAEPAARIVRQQVASTLVGSTVWVAGGLLEGAATPQVEGFDVTVDSWKRVADLPVPLHHAMAVTYRGDLWVLGGWQPVGADVNAITSNRVFVLMDGKWEEQPPMNHARAAGAAVVLDDHIVVVGGQADRQLVTQTEVWDGAEWRDGAPMPTPREHLAAVARGDRLYAVGGRDLSPDRNTNALERYDVGTDQWEALAPMPTARGSLGAAVVADRLVAVGGETSEAVLDTVEAYDFASGTWSALPPLPTPRHGLAVVGTGTTLYAINGATATSHAQATDVVEALDFQ